jgi:calcium/calmodulin-dependent protein kinase I
MAIATLIYHILKGVKLIHNSGYFHGNLKLENVIFSQDKKENEIYLINIKYNEEANDLYRERLIKKGQNYYIAPEVLEGKPFDSKIDMFAIGVCFFYMIFEKFPYTQIEKCKDSNNYNYILDL